MNRSNTLWCTLTVLWLFGSCLTGAAQVTGSLKTYILDRHNAARADVRNCRAKGKRGTLPKPKSMNALRWSTNLAKTASLYAQSCAKPFWKNDNEYMCVHSSEAKWTPSGGWSRYGLSRSPGENIGCPGWKSNNALTEAQAENYLKQMIDDELKKYWYQNKYYYASGHYTQIIWQQTTQVGCGYAKCNDGIWMVCHYNPPGNYPRYPYEKQSECGSVSAPNPTRRPTRKPVASSGGGSGSCIQVSRLRTRLNGQWKKVGTKNGSPYYTKYSGPTKLYLFKGSWGSYAINNKLSAPSDWTRNGYCGKKTGIVSQCSGGWAISGKYDTDSTFVSKACGAFEEEDISCFDNYAPRLHFYEGKTAEPSHVFDRDDAEGCVGEEPMYRYEEEQNAMRYELYFDATRWVIESIQNVSNYEIQTDVLVCNERDLYECTNGTWLRRVISQYVSGEEEDANVNNVTIAVSVSNAETYLVIEDAVIKAPPGANGEPKGVVGSDGGSWVAVVVCVALILVLVVLACLLYRYFNKRKMTTNAKQMEIPDEEEEEEEEEEVEENEVEVTVPIHTTS